MKVNTEALSRLVMASRPLMTKIYEPRKIDTPDRSCQREPTAVKNGLKTNN